MSGSTLRIHDWSRLDDAGRKELLRRPVQRDQDETMAGARAIVARVRHGGDRALLDLTEEHDHVRLAGIRVPAQEVESAATALSRNEKRAIETAIGTVRAFHEAQVQHPLRVETAPGVVCERITVPLQAIGMYVPAGTAPLPSTALMIGVPAQIAGCRRRVLCTPPRRDGMADPGVLYTAQACGVTDIFKVGGAQAVAAMAYGTESVPKVDKIFGPGNAWVTAAKLAVAMDPEGAAYDMPAGPSEVLVIADHAAHPEFVAADLLAQAEHSADAQVLLVTNSRNLAHAVIHEIDRQLARLSRGDIVRAALAGSRIILVNDLETALEVSNLYAPEHLIIETERARDWLASVRHAGSVFLGAWTPESMGDYCSGTNHVLPTNGFARCLNGLSVFDFMKRITIQQATADGLAELASTATTMAEWEGLTAHALAVSIRQGQEVAIEP